MTVDAMGMPGRGPRVRLDVAYVGAGFHGWQIQPGLRTVQGELAGCLERLLGRRCVPVGAGRTDTGVHARGQVAHVSLDDLDEVVRVVRALPRMVPDDIQVCGAREVSPYFDARRSATARRYAYHLQLERNLFIPHAFQVPWHLETAAMDAACAHLVGTHDFASFCRATSLRDDNVCRVDRCGFEWSDTWGIFHVRADRFLHNMVRNLVGVLLEVGARRRDAASLPAVLAARDRRAAGMRAPAHGLFLEEVSYPPVLEDPLYRPTDEGDRA